MGEIKTKVTNANVRDFISKVPDETKRNDSFTLLKIYQDITKEKPKMWGGSMIGFGKYHYKSERSSQEGDWPLAAFSPRKQSLTLYVMMDMGANDKLFKKLGKHKRSVGCLYINKLDDVHLPTLKQIIKKSYLAGKKRFKV